MLIVSFLLTAGCTVEIKSESRTVSSHELRVHFIDVGQADSILIELPNDEIALIDGGNRADGELVVNYLKDNNIEKIDYLLATHPHEDHIGGLPVVVDSFHIGSIYMPRKSVSTEIFETLVNSIKSNDLKATVAEGGLKIIDDGELKFSIIAPNSDDYSETNDFSIVCKLEYKDKSFLFTGDAEGTSEKEIIKAGYDLSADVLKVGHHGGSTSTTEEFLNEVEPTYAVISVAKDNDHGHPHKETIEKLNERNINVLRTDELGTIIISTDGKNISIPDVSTNNIEKTDSQSTEEVIIGNKNTKVYHLESCNSLPKPENQIIFKSRADAEDNGYKPHNTCVK